MLIKLLIETWTFNGSDQDDTNYTDKTILIEPISLKRVTNTWLLRHGLSLGDLAEQINHTESRIELRYTSKTQDTPRPVVCFMIELQERWTAKEIVNLTLKTELKN